MSVPYGNFQDLSHQIRFLLFEIGIGLSQNNVDYFITLAHKEILRRLQTTVQRDGLIERPITCHHIYDFLTQLQTNPSLNLNIDWPVFRCDIDEAIINEALSLAYRACWNNRLKNEIQPYRNLWDFLIQTKTAYEHFSFLEQWTYTADVFNTEFNAFSGFSGRELLQYSPQFQSKISMHWAAVQKEHVKINTHLSDLKKVFADHYPLEWLEWEQKLLLQHQNPNDFYPILIHPWQWRNELQKIYSSMIDSKLLILLPHHQTLLPTTGINRFISEQNTAYCFTVPVSIKSQNMKQALKQEYRKYKACGEQNVLDIINTNQHYKDSIFLANPISSLEILSGTISCADKNNTGYGVSQNPVQFIETSQRVIPFDSLFSSCPQSNKPLLIHIINSSTLNPVEYFSYFCQKIILPLNHIFTHEDNILKIEDAYCHLVLENNVPEALILHIHDQEKGTHFFQHKPSLIPGLKGHNQEQIIKYYITPVLSLLVKEYSISYQDVHKIIDTIGEHKNNPLNKRYQVTGT